MNRQAPLGLAPGFCVCRAVTTFDAAKQQGNVALDLSPELKSGFVTQLFPAISRFRAVQTVADLAMICRDCLAETPGDVLGTLDALFVASLSSCLKHGSRNVVNSFDRVDHLCLVTC